MLYHSIEHVSAGYKIIQKSRPRSHKEQGVVYCQMNLIKIVQDKSTLKQYEMLDCHASILFR